MYEKKQVGERLMGMRKERRLKRNTVAEAIDYSEESLKAAELGKCLSLNMIIALAEYYGVSIDYIIFGFASDKDAYAVEHLLRSVPEERKSLAINAIKGVISAFV